MTFAEQLAGYSGPQIVAALGCPRATAYAWLDGSRKPPEWQQALFLAAIALSQAEIRACQPDDAPGV